MTAVIWVRQVIKKYANFGWSTELSESPSEQKASNQPSLSHAVNFSGKYIDFYEISW